MRALRSAFAYFSIAPVGGGREPGPEALDALPIVGITLGFVAGSIGRAIARNGPRSLGVAAAFGLPIVLTGALHVDGFLDASDALFAETSVERRLAILKDPRAGSYAVASFAVVSVFSLASLQAIEPEAYPYALAFTGGIVRIAALANAYRYPYARSADSAGFFSRAPAPSWLTLAGTAACLAGMRAQRFSIPSALALAAAGSALGIACARRLGGRLVGDAYGFIIVALEPLALASCAIFARNEE